MYTYLYTSYCHLIMYSRGSFSSYMICGLTNFHLSLYTYFMSDLIICIFLLTLFMPTFLIKIFATFIFCLCTRISVAINS